MGQSLGIPNAKLLVALPLWCYWHCWYLLAIWSIANHNAHLSLSVWSICLHFAINRCGWLSIWLTLVPRPRVPSIVHTISVITWVVIRTMPDTLAWPRSPSSLKSLLSRRTLWVLETAFKDREKHDLSSQKWVHCSPMAASWLSCR